MKTRSNILRCVMAAIAIAVAATAYSLTQDNKTNGTQAPAQPAACYGHGCCGHSRAYTGHHGCRPAPPRHNRRGHHGCGYAHAYSRGYHCDESHACYHGRSIEDADLKTFTPLGGGYAKDSRHAYYAGRPIAGADAKTFRHIGRGVAKDKRNTYIDGRKTD